MIVGVIITKASFILILGFHETESHNNLKQSESRDGIYPHVTRSSQCVIMLGNKETKASQKPILTHCIELESAVPAADAPVTCSPALDPNGAARR